MYSSKSEWNWGTLIVAIILLCSIYPILVMLLWNWLMPLLFGLPLIGFWEAFGLNWLCAILFKNTTIHKED